ncbi:MAG: Uma2 family endonuclease [Candidatus Magnetoovum sp. WYHC-5]|nr:Uma2 family endonuclease [Candidatus Magnetoovum sp. WYHC-5]MCI4627013.1 Uma2 family endonuclease [Candidatus Magnetoovum sp. WYHC-5]
MDTIQIKVNPKGLSASLSRDFDLTEIINGKEVMGPSPFFKHQDVVFNLGFILKAYVKKNNLGKVSISPLDVILEEGVNRMQPDLLFIKKENMWIIKEWIRGVPDMVCEIVSQGSYTRDTIIKKEIYESYKVPEYWIVIPELSTIEILTLEDGKYQPFSIAEGEGVVKSNVISGFEVEIKDVFEE